MLLWRILVSVVLIPAAVGLFWLDARAGASAPFLLALCLLLAVRGCWEMTALLRTRSFEPRFPLVALCAVVVILAGWPAVGQSEGAQKIVTGTLGSVALAYALCVLLLLLMAAVQYVEPGKNIETLGAELLIVSYIGILLAVTAQLRWMGTTGGELLAYPTLVSIEVGTDGRAGYLALGSLILAAKCGDIGAYTLGRLLGRRKMTPRLSPGKTWMGGVGAILGAAAGGWAWLQFVPPLFDAHWSSPAAAWSLLYGAAIGGAGLVGDLCESLIKRDVGQKDSASLLPGFGGLLDLIDSVLYAGPLAVVLWNILPLRVW